MKLYLGYHLDKESYDVVRTAKTLTKNLHFIFQLSIISKNVANL